MVKPRATALIREGRPEKTDETPYISLRTSFLSEQFFLMDLRMRSGKERSLNFLSVMISTSPLVMR
jgi:hypothetical protein